MPFYHIVIADGRAPRDGKFIEKIGTYNPLSKPAEININFESAIKWLQNGAQPTDTVRAILSYQGVLYKNHLQVGVKKGAMTQEQADMKFEAWLKEKQEKVLTSIKQGELTKKEAKKKRFEAEAKVNEARAKEQAAKRAKELAAQREAAETSPAEGTEPLAAVPAAEETVVAVEEAVAAAEETVMAPEETAVIEEVPSAEATAEASVEIPEEMPEQTEAPAAEEAGEEEEAKA
jgi:small subunit ribosomal protein S16